MGKFVLQVMVVVIVTLVLVIVFFLRGGGIGGICGGLQASLHLELMSAGCRPPIIGHLGETAACQRDALPFYRDSNGGSGFRD